MTDIKSALEKLHHIKEDLQVNVEQSTELFGYSLEDVYRELVTAIEDLEQPVRNAPSLANYLPPENVEIKELSPEMLAFVEANFERLDHIADEHLWLNEHFSPLLSKDIPNRDEGWYISVNRKRYERIRRTE